MSCVSIEYTITPFAFGVALSAIPHLDDNDPYHCSLRQHFISPAQEHELFFP
jgi:hypothetical protein